MSVMRGQILNLSQALKDAKRPWQRGQMPVVYVERYVHVKLPSGLDLPPCLLISAVEAGKKVLSAILAVLPICNDIANISAIGRSKGPWMLLGVMSLWSIQKLGKPKKDMVGAWSSIQMLHSIYVELLASYELRIDLMSSFIPRKKIIFYFVKSVV